MEALLRVENLTKVFPRQGRENDTAVKDISFALLPGEVLGMIGESGSGKTTLVNMITRLLEPTAGRIFLNGEDITCVRGRELRRIYRSIQMVFQSPADSFDPRRTLGAGIGESLQNYGWSAAASKKRAAQLLELCGLPASFSKRYAYQVSGGQCQRAAIARAIAIQPRILILDEATSALDVTIQAEILALLKKLRRELDMSYLFICHDLALVQDFCDRVLVMHQGSIVEEGIPDEVFRCPKNEYTRRLIESAL